MECENNTVNSEIFVRILFLRNFACEIKPPPKDEITLSFTDIGKLYPNREFFNVASVSFNANRKKF